MGKRRRSGKEKKSGKERRKENKVRKDKTNPLLYAAGAVIVLAVGFFGLKSMGVIGATAVVNLANASDYLERVKEAGLIETRPLMPANRYRGRAALDYKRAVEIPEALDALYCYCRCKENPRTRHKTLLTCFTDDHAANCGICLSQMEMAYEMTMEGKTAKEIRIAEDDYFGKKG
ncbi:MAG: PCYCGC motif-containing (lipo)protein [Nitrospinota bacterium]